MIREKHMKKYILGIGGANMDILIKSDKRPVLRDSNPSTVTTSCGGVMRNIMENLARLDENVILLTAIGNDDFAEIIVNHCKDVGMNMDHVFKDVDHHTSIYSAFLDEEKDMLIAGVDMDILKHLPSSYFDEKQELFENASLVCIDTNFGEQTIEKIVSLAKDVPIYADPVSSAKSARLLKVLPKLHTIKPNIYELEILSGMNCGTNEEIIKASASLLDKGLKEIIVSLGEKGIYYANSEGESFFRSLGQCEMVNATGAGDSFFAGFIKGRVQHLDTLECIDYGLASGMIAVRSEETISKEMSISKIKEVLNASKITK